MGGSFLVKGDVSEGGQRAEVEKGHDWGLLFGGVVRYGNVMEIKGVQRLLVGGKGGLDWGKLRGILKATVSETQFF